MSTSPQSSTDASRAEMRRHRRVSVRLDVVVVLDRQTSCNARTANMSESGVLLEGYDGPELTEGRMVGLNMRGVLCDEETDDVERYLMRVVRQQGDSVALRFAS